MKTDIREQLNDFEDKVCLFKKANFKSFTEYEIECITLINHGNNIRKYILAHPEICNKHTIDFLNNKNPKMLLVEDEYKCLAQILYLTKELLKKYDKQIIQQLKNLNPDEVITLCYKMFQLTKNDIYIRRAGIYCLFFNNPKTKKLFEYLKEDIVLDNKFYWELSNLCKNFEKYYLSVFYAKCAIEKEREIHAKNISNLTLL